MTGPIKTTVEPLTPSTELLTPSPVTPPTLDPSSSVTPDKTVVVPVDNAAPASGAPAIEAPASAVDEGYDLELSDDSPLTEEDLNEIAEEAGRLSLNKEDAQKLIAMKEKGYANGKTQVETAYQAKLVAAHKEIASDPMFQGEQKVKSFESMSRAIETFGDDDLVALVKSPEFGNNVVLARFLKRLGDALAPDTDSLTGGKGSAGKPEESHSNGLKQMYPSFFKD